MEGVELCDWTDRSYNKSSYFKRTHTHSEERNSNQFNGVLMLWIHFGYDICWLYFDYLQINQFHIRDNGNGCLEKRLKLNFILTSIEPTKATHSISSASDGMVHREGDLLACCAV